METMTIGRARIEKLSDNSHMIYESNGEGTSIPEATLETEIDNLLKKYI